MAFGTISQTLANQTAKANNLFDAVGPVSVYGYNAELTVGLNFAYFGGLVTVTGGSKVTITGTIVAMTASTTNYVVMALSTGAVSASTATTNWNDTANYARLYTVVTATSSITTITDFRQPSEYLGSVAYNDARLTDAREWTAGTVTQAEAEAGTATTRRAWTAERVKQAVNAVAKSGTFTPTLTPTTNVAASAPSAARYTRVGSVVTVSGDVLITATATGAVVLSLSLPVASALTSAAQLSGVASSVTVSGRITGDATNDVAVLEFVASTTTATVYTYTFSYDVV